MNEFVWPERNPELGAWFGSEELKAWAVARMIEHREQDRLIQRIYQEGQDPFVDAATEETYRGCLIGCVLPFRYTLYASDMFVLPGGEQVKSHFGQWHYDVETLLGIPAWIAEQLDNRFENMDFEAAAVFAVASIEAIPVGQRYELTEDAEETVGPLWTEDFLEWLENPR